jgi:hypothetical protein
VLFVCHRISSDIIFIAIDETNRDLKIMIKRMTMKILKKAAIITTTASIFLIKKIKFFVFLVNYICDEYGELSHQPTAPST